MLWLAAVGGRTAVTNRAEPAPENPAGQEANKALWERTGSSSLSDTGSAEPL